MTAAIRAADYSQVAELTKEIPDASRFSKDDIKSLKKSSQEFEAMFLQLMLKSMRDSVPKSELIKGGNGEDIFRGMLDAEYAQSMAGQSFTGIAATIERQLMGISETPSKDLAKEQMLQKYSKAAP